VIRWLLAVVALPLVGLVIAEVGLRAAGYGRPMRPFITRSVGHQRVHIRNMAFFNLFYARPKRFPELASSTDDFEVVEPKPPNTYRIFVFGGSAAQGWLGPEASFPRVLKAMLKTRFPATDFQVYNMACAGMNSHVMRVLAKACAHLEPDAFLVYTGNNEMGGPFGLTAAMSNGGRVPNLYAARAQIFLGNLRLRQWLVEHVSPVIERLRRLRRLTPASASLRHDDPRVSTVLRHFEDNLKDLSAAGRSGGATVILSTMGANLRDWTPTELVRLRALNKNERAEWKRLFQEGLAQQESGAYRAALSTFRRAAAIEDTYAALPFRMGRCHFELAEYDAARACFRKALDHDSFRWARSKSSINEIIRSTASAHGYPLADAEARLAEASPGGIPGSEMFFDACHLTFRGNYAVAGAFFDRLLPVLPRRVLGRTEAVPGPPSEDECRRLLYIDPHAEANQRAEALSSQGASDEEAARVETRTQADVAAFPVESSEEGIACLEAALRVMAPDGLLQERYVTGLSTQIHDDRTLEAARTFVEQFPFHRQSRWLLAQILSEKGQFAEAKDQLDWLLALYPEDPQTLTRYGDVLQRAGEPEAALVYYARGQIPEGMDLNSQLLKAQSFEALGRTQEAVALYREVAECAPGFEESFARLDAIYQKEHDGRSRTLQWRSYVSSRPEEPLGHLYLGRALEDTGACEEAIAAYRRAAELAPKDLRFREWLAAALRQCGRLEDALQVYRDITRVDPQHAEARIEEGRLLERLGRGAEAIEAYTAAAFVRGQDESVYDALDSLVSRVEGTEGRVRLWKRLAEEGPESGLVQKHLTTVLGAASMRQHAATMIAEGRPEEALRSYSEALSADVHDAETYIALEALFASGACGDDQEQFWRRVIDACPDSGRAYWYLAQALREKGEGEDRVSALERAAALSPRDAGIQAELGRVLFDLGQYEASIPALERAIGINPEVTYVRPMLVAAHYESGHVDAARAELARCRGLGIDVPNDLVEVVEGGSR